MNSSGPSREGTPTVSVIIPTYNRAKWLPETVGSVLAQTVPPLEVLIVDDGSTDDTREVCDRFPPPVRYVRQDNAGVAAARNRGAAQARGEWLAFLDSDDVWTPDKLEVQLAALAATGAGWCITDFEMVSLKGHRLEGVQGLRRAFPLFRDVVPAPEEFFAEHFDSREVTAAGRRHTVYHGDPYVPLFYGNFASPSGVVVRSDHFQEAGGFDEGLYVAEDTEFFHRLAARAPLAIVMTPTFRWRTGHAVSLVSSSTEGMIRNALLSVDRAAARQDPLPDRARDAYLQGRRSLLRRLAYWQLSELDRSGARATLRELRASGAGVSMRWLALWAASLLPTPVLRRGHALKRRMRW